MDHPAFCSGATGCSFTPHVHGCFEDTGNCNEPQEHLLPLPTADPDVPNPDNPDPARTCTGLS